MGISLLAADEPSCTEKPETCESPLPGETPAGVATGSTHVKLAWSLQVEPLLLKFTPFQQKV